MPRKHGTADDTRQVRIWINRARYILKKEKHIKEHKYEVSVNDVWDLIKAEKLLPPPVIKQGAKRGQALCNIFRNDPHYSNTGKTELAAMPSNKGRRVVVWEYHPEEACENTPDFFNIDSTAW